MSRPSTTLAPSHGAFSPTVIALDVSEASLAAFRSESEVFEPPARAGGPAHPAPEARKVTLRVPRWLAAGGLAILGGAFGALIVNSVSGQGAVLPALGSIAVTSEPLGARVEIDDVVRGTTPFAASLAPGTYRVQVGDGPAPREHVLEVTPGTTASVHIEWTAARVPPVPASVEQDAGARAGMGNRSLQSEAASPAPTAVGERGSTAISRAAASPAPRPAARTSETPRPAPSGWLALSSPFPVRVLKDGEDVGGSLDRRVALPAGAHSVVLVNESLEFRETRDITVPARRTVSLTVARPAGTLHVNASPWASIWIEDRRLGDTPLGNVSLPIGEYEVVFRHPQLGEERRRVTVPARTPARVSLEFQP